MSIWQKMPMLPAPADNLPATCGGQEAEDTGGHRRSSFVPPDIRLKADPVPVDRYGAGKF